MGFQTFTCCICGKEGLTKRTSYMIEGKGRACREHHEALDANNDREVKRAEVLSEKLHRNMHWKEPQNNRPIDLRCTSRGSVPYATIKSVRTVASEYELIRDVIYPLMSKGFEDNCLHCTLTISIEEFRPKLIEMKKHDEVLMILGCFVCDVIFGGSDTTTCMTWCGSKTAKDDYEFIKDWVNWYLSIPGNDKIPQICDRFIITATKLFELFHNAMVMAVKSDHKTTKDQALHVTSVYANALSNMGDMFSSIYDEMNIKDQINKDLDMFVTKTIRNISFIKGAFLNGGMDVNELFDAFKCTFADCVHWIKKQGEAYTGMLIVNHDEIVAKTDAYQKVVTTTNSTPREIRLKYMELLKF